MNARACVWNSTQNIAFYLTNVFVARVAVTRRSAYSYTGAVWTRRPYDRSKGRRPGCATMVS